MEETQNEVEPVDVEALLAQRLISEEEPIPVKKSMFGKAEKNPDGSYIQYIVMDALLAEKLWKSNDNVRKLSNPTVLLMAKAMIAGTFGKSSPLLVDVNGKLRDGQHRIAAFLKASKIIEGLKLGFYIQFNATEETIRTTDIGRKRNLALYIGEEFPEFGNFAFNIATTAMLRTDDVYSGVLVSVPEMVDFIRRHYDAFNFVFKETGLTRIVGLKRVGFLAAVLRAYYHVPKETLIRFSMIARGDFKQLEPAFTSKDNLVLEYVNKYIRPQKGGGGSAISDTYVKTEKVIEDYFLGKGNSMYKNFPIEKIGFHERFLLPEEMEDSGQLPVKLKKYNRRLPNNREIKSRESRASL